MKKVITLVCAVLVIAFVVSVPIVNNRSASKVEDMLLNIPLPADTVLVDSLSKAGKLVGNGNGMQYFGAILIKSNLSLEELIEYYTDHDQYLMVKKQDGAQIKFIEHENVCFEAEVNPQEGYYMVCLFGSGIAPFSQLDLRGH